MSFTTTIDIFCDGEGCGDWTHGDVTTQRWRAESAAKAKGWTQGWRKGKKIHLCPLCNGKAKLKCSDGSYVFKERAHGV